MSRTCPPTPRPPSMTLSPTAPHPHAWLSVAALLLLASVQFAADPAPVVPRAQPAGPARADDGADFFEKKVRPVLAEYCYACHSVAAKKERGGLRLDTPDAIRTGGESGPVVK